MRVLSNPAFEVGVLESAHALEQTPSAVVDEHEPAVPVLHEPLLDRLVDEGSEVAGDV